jgi:hypothetical protein
VRMQNSLVFSVVDRPRCTLPSGPRLDRERRAGRQACPAQLLSHDAETECDKVLAASDPPFGPLQSLVDDPTTQIIRVNRYDHVLVRRGGRQQEMPNVRFPDDLSVRLFIEHVTGRQTATLGDLVHPLPGEMLLVAYFPPLNAHVTVSLFKPATKAERWDELIGDVLPEQAAKDRLQASCCRSGFWSAVDTRA